MLYRSSGPRQTYVRCRWRSISIGSSSLPEVLWQKRALYKTILWWRYGLLILITKQTDNRKVTRRTYWEIKTTSEIDWNLSCHPRLLRLHRPLFRRRLTSGTEWPLLQSSRRKRDAQWTQQTYRYNQHRISPSPIPWWKKTTNLIMVKQRKIIN